MASHAGLTGRCDSSRMMHFCTTQFGLSRMVRLCSMTCTHCTYSQSWKMAFNGKKCHVMHVTRNRTITRCSYTLGQDKLTPVSHHPYLGVELDDHLNWKEQTERARSKGVRMLNMIRRNFTRGTTPMIRCEMYKSLVRPSMEYGSIVWDPHQQTRMKTLEVVQNKGARYIYLP